MSQPYPAVIPYLAASDAAAAIEFYKTAFGAEERYRLVDPSQGKIGHAELLIGGQLVMIADEFPGHNISPKTLHGTTVQLMLMVENTDEVYAAALAAGATSVSAPEDAFYGHRVAQIIDPAGHQWSLQQEVEALSPEAIKARWEGMMTS